jgi:hypothetical protein
LRLLFRVKVVNGDNPDYTVKAYGSDIGSVQFVDEFAIHRVLFLEDVHFKVLKVRLSDEFLGTASLTGLRAMIEILQVHVIMEVAYNVEDQSLAPSIKALFGEVSICHD